MGWVDRLRVAFGGRPRAFEPRTFDQPTVMRFAANPVLPVDQMIEHLAKKLGLIDREQALRVPAVLKGRNLICSVCTLPLQAIDEDNRIQRRPLFRQFDVNTPNAVIIAQTIEDLLFEAVAWWRVTGFDADGYPSRVVRYEPRLVSLQAPSDYQRGYLPSGLPTEGVVWMEGHPVPFDQVIRFDSPNPALLTAAGDTIRRAVLLNQAAELYASSPRRRGFFTPTDGVDPANDAAIEAALDAWQAASTERLDGYVPAALAYTAIQDSTPAELQLVQMQERVTLDLANTLGLDPEDLGMSTTSRTYQNATDRRRDRINDVLSPYMAAITDRLGMPDVTPEDETVRFWLDDYLRADPRTRAEVQQIYAGMGVTDPAEIRDEEGKPPRKVQVPVAPPASPVVEARRVPSTVGAALDAPAEVTFSAAAPAMTFDAPVTDGFAVDDDARTVTGLLVPWGQYARSGGKTYRFEPGSIVWSSIARVKLLRDHDNSSAFGRAVRLWEDDRGLWGTFKVAAGRRGDEALALAADGVLDGFSVGVDMRTEDMSPDPERPAAWRVHRGALRETSMTAVPSFDDSRLTSVRASREGNQQMNCPDCGQPITDGVAHVCPTPAATPTATPAATPAAPVTFTADQFAAFMAALPSAAPAAPARPTVDPTRAPVAVTQVEEPHPYHFSVSNGRTVFSRTSEHDFSTDLFALLKDREFGQMTPDAAAAQGRINTWVSENFAAAEAVSRDRIRATFDIDRADTTDKTAPNRYRSDMYQAQMQFPSPLWDMLNAGTTDERKFDIPKFNSSSGLVGPATEGTEPAPGAMTVTTQTITPTQVWGKVEVTRQAWRIGGNPQLSGLLWGQMLEEYYEDREAAAAAFLNTLTAATDIALTGVDASPSNDEYQANVAQLEAGIADLQFQRGGRTIRSFAVHQALYRVLAAVQDDQGRPLYPIISPSNANGTAQPGYNYIDIAGVRAVPAYGLGTAGGNTSVNSWLFSASKVFGWADAPERLFWDFGATVQTANIPQLSHVTVGIYGNVAFGNTDIAGVRQVTYDQNTAA